MKITCPYHKNSDRLRITCGCPEIDHTIKTQYPQAKDREETERLFCSAEQRTQEYCEVYRIIEATKNRTRTQEPPGAQQEAPEGR